VLGRFDEAEVRLRRALDLEERMGARPFAARTRGALAATLEQQGSTEAEALRKSAIAEANALGAAGIAAEINA